MESLLPHLKSNPPCHVITSLPIPLSSVPTHSPSPSSSPSFTSLRAVLSSLQMSNIKYSYTSITPLSSVLLPSTLTNLPIHVPSSTHTPPLLTQISRLHGSQLPVLLVHSCGSVMSKIITYVHSRRFEFQKIIITGDYHKNERYWRMKSCEECEVDRVEIQVGEEVWNGDVVVLGNTKGEGWSEREDYFKKKVEDFVEDDFEVLQLVSSASQSNELIGLGVQEIDIWKDLNTRSDVFEMVEKEVKEMEYNDVVGRAWDRILGNLKE
ncbi:hypothetical protein TrVE_jg3956 [Triparma verrucosa]|uniref:Uncharacterized protein n=1 Tax=Triparma verrucosa TaxID=1606542 RepID=A0A9W7BGL7_9STRA|nr:hypothetical protein TrVE_jg3956 [Triparma verrucosa]